MTLSAAVLAAPADDKKLVEYNQAFRTAKNMELLRKMAALPADTKNKLTVICNAATLLPDSEEAIRFLASLKVEKKDANKVNGALVRIYSNEAFKAIPRGKKKLHDRTKFDAMLEKIMALPADTPTRTFYVVRLVNGLQEPDTALSVLAKLEKENLSAGDLRSLQDGVMTAYVEKGKNAVKALDLAAYKAILTKLEAMPADHPQRQRKLQEFLLLKPEFALSQADRLKLEPSTRISLFHAAAKAAAARYDRSAFDKYFAELEKFQPDPAAVLAVIALADKLDGDKPMPYLTALEKKTDLTDAVRFALYDKIRSMHRMNTTPYGFAEPEAYGINKAYLKKQLALSQKNDKLPNKEKVRGILSASMLIQRNLYPIFCFGDYAFAEELLTLWHKDVGDGNFPCDLFRMKNALRKKDTAAAKAVLAGAEANPKMKIDDVYRLRGLAYFASHTDCKGFDKAVYGDKQPTAEERYRLLSWISAEAFRATRHDICMAIMKEIRGNMFKPVTRLTFSVPYGKDCPQTADAWSRTPGFSWDKLETRFKVYADMYEDSHNTNIKRHLKGTEDVAYPEENKAGLAFAFDDRALHIYVRVNDPAIDEVRDGKRKGPSFEMLFRPGNDCAYYTNYLLETPSTENTFPQDWQRPGTDYTLMHDFIQRDIAMTADSMAVHYAIPFKAFYNKLPLNGRNWTFGLQVWGKTALTISGAVHELSRMGILNIQFTPEQEKTIRRLIVKAVLNDAIRQIGNQAEYPFLWSDDVLGDPEFFKKEVKPVFDDLYAAQEALPNVPDADLDAFYQKYAHTAAKLKDIIAEKRAAYIRMSLLEIDGKGK